MIEIYKKKPVSVAVLAWTGENFDEVKKFAGDMAFMEDGNLFIHTLEDTDKSNHAASVGDLIVRGIKGEFYPVKPDVFLRTYEPCSESEVDAYWHKRLEESSKSTRDNMKSVHDQFVAATESGLIHVHDTVAEGK